MDRFTAGKYIKSNINAPEEYEYFLPQPINREFSITNKKILTSLEQATRLLGELNAYGELVPDVNFFIRMHVVSEAVSSSGIEGTKTGMDEALLAEEDISPEKRDDWREVNNYILALDEAIESLSQLPVSLRLIKDAHKILLSGVRGEHKLPGEVRRSQNWIGGSSINTAHFVPPAHNHLSDLLTDWEKFWHNETLNLPVLIKIAISHYQFETIHPFLDGNGRMGRLLIILQLIERSFLKYPLLYISDFFERYRPAYYDGLTMVRQQNNLEPWILFFLEAVVETAEQSIDTFKNILALRGRYENDITKLGRKVPRAKNLLLKLFANPIMNVRQVQEYLEVGYPAANNLINDFVELSILSEQTGYTRNRQFAMRDYIRLFRK